jgi:IS5 family transposase
LLKINAAVNCELFCTEISKLRDKPRISKAGAKPYAAVMMCKVLLLQSLYNLSDEAVEYQLLNFGDIN